MKVRYFQNADGEYIGAFVNGTPPMIGVVEISAPPNDQMVWNNGTWIAPTPPAPTGADVRNERQRRVLLGLTHRSKIWQIDLESRNLIAGAVQGASLFIGGGGSGTDLRWRSADKDATWTAFDNSALTFTPNEMIAFGLAVLAHIGALHDASRTIQALDPIPADYAANARWP